MTCDPVELELVQGCGNLFINFNMMRISELHNASVLELLVFRGLSNNMRKM